MVVVTSRKGSDGIALDIETLLSAKIGSHMSWDIQSIPDSGIEKYTFRGYLSLFTSLLIVIVVVVVVFVVVVIVIIIIIIISYFMNRIYFLFRIKSPSPLPNVSNDFCERINETHSTVATASMTVDH